MEDQKVIYEKKNGIGYLTLNNPAKLNSIDVKTFLSLSKLLDEVDSDPGVLAVILTGAGEKAFAAGGDILDFKFDVKGGRENIRVASDAFEKMERCTKPIISAVKGLALGGGMELVLSSDLVVASEDALFGLPESSLGLVPLWGLIRLHKIVGRVRAKEILMTSRRLKAKEALDWGIINMIVPKEEVMPAAEKMAKDIMSKGPLAIQLIKSGVNKDIEGEDVTYTKDANLLIFLTEDFKEGATAFGEKRKPLFKGA
jgi:enoyl-CoA hydratase